MNIVNYNIKTILKNKFKICKGKRAHICIYNIVNTDINPFLTYLLYKHSNDMLSFPNFIINENVEKEADTMVNKITKFNIENEGFIENNNDIYIFYNLKTFFKKQNLYESTKELFWCTIYEICNSRKVLNYDVHSSVTDIFLENSILIYILNDENVPYIIPRIGYYGCYYKLIDYIVLLGIQQTSYTPLGNFIYFNNFKRAFKYGGWLFKGNENEEKKHIITDKYDRYDKGGIIRFAVFLKNTKYFLNHPSDKKQDNANTYDNEYEESRLIDLTGEWSKTNDSAYIGIIKLSDKSGGEKIFHKNIREQYIVKNIDDYFSLSSHLIDKSTLGKEWDYNDNYKII